MKDETNKTEPVPSEQKPVDTIDDDPWDPRIAGPYRESSLWAAVTDGMDKMCWASHRVALFLPELEEGELAGKADELFFRSLELARLIRGKRPQTL